MHKGYRQIATLVLGLVLLSTGVVWLHVTQIVHLHSESTPSQESLARLHKSLKDHQTALQCPGNLELNNSAKYGDLKPKSNFTSGSYAVYREKILILTPVSNSAKKLSHYFSLLCSLTYPHQLISVALGEDSSTDKTLEIAGQWSRKLSPYFNSVKVFHLSGKMKVIPVYSRHDPEMQLGRRTHLAHARNQLLMRGLQDEDWVLWIDSDVDYVPPDLIQHLLSAHSDIAVPSCMYKDDAGKTLVYDRNTWRETAKSREYLRDKHESYLMLEGYSLTLRTYLPYLAHEGPIVPIDGVGGCVLLVRAESHRKGLVFPPFVFEHHIETEGLAKMAAKMGLSVKGLPMLNVFHS